jgi:hypothetical protein
MSTHRSRAFSVLPRTSAPPLPDWSKLSRGDAVTAVHKNGRVITGRIEMMALDRSVFWVIQEGGLGRAMVYGADKPLVTKAAQPERRS